MNKLTGCRFKNTKTDKIVDVWVSKRQFESNSFKYNREYWIQIPYELDNFGRYEK